ncbi:MAG: methyltransferase domain-containing protein [Bacteroidetes bacterium]|nr:methyltransferase domain-containing protein [Bacteroidota bacterium]
MDKSYYSHTTYKDAEDLKRLDFIVDSIKKLGLPNAKILDVGCGNGNISMALGSIGFNVVGVDIDETSIQNATKKNTFSNIQFKIIDANSFTMNDEFDAVVCSEVLEHLEVPSDLVGSIFRILKPGGVLVATVPNGHGPREVLITKPMQWLHKREYDGPLLALKKIMGYSNTTRQSSNPDLTHIQFFSVSSIQKLMSDRGFKLLKFDNADFIEKIFPYSFLTRRIYFLQKLDCSVANYIPKFCTSGFYTSWTKPKN